MTMSEEVTISVGIGGRAKGAEVGRGGADDVAVDTAASAVLKRIAVGQVWD